MEATTVNAAAQAVSLATPDMIKLAAGLAMGLAVVGAGIGIGIIGASAVGGLARQPEAEGKIRTMMILAIAFLEPLALIALIFGIIGFMK